MAADVHYTLRGGGFEPSPIREFYPQWKEMNLDRKTRYLIDSGQAANWSAARSLLARHRVAVTRNRKHREWLKMQNLKSGI